LSTITIRRFPSRAILAAAVAAAIVGSMPSAALAADTVDPLWYYNNYGVAEFAAEGFDGSGVKVAVIDSVINPDVPQLAGTNLTVREPSFCADWLENDDRSRVLPATSDVYYDSYHATNQVAFLVGNGKGPGGATAQLGVSPGADVTLYAINSKPLDVTIECETIGDYDSVSGKAIGMANAITAAVDDGNDIISIASPHGGPDPLLFEAVAHAVREGVVILAARPNDMSQTQDIDIWGMNGVVTVQSMGADGRIQAASAVADLAIDVVGPGTGVVYTDGDFDTMGISSGTSEATAITAGYLAVVKSKYPDATGNQLIQSLITNTGLEDHEPVKDGQGFLGYGAVSLRHMLENDPTTYDDVNPLVDTTDAARPFVADIYPDGAPGSTPDESEPGSDADTANIAPIIIGGVIALVVLLAIILVTVVLVRRSNRAAR